MEYETKARIRILLVILVVLGLSVWGVSDGVSLNTYTAIGVGLAVLHGLAALWVRHDARKRGSDQVGVWMAAVLAPAIGVFGFIAYLSNRNSHPDH